MSTADGLRVQLAVAELQERLAALKGSGDQAALAACKEDLRYVRWVARGGPAVEEAARAAIASGEQPAEPTNRHTAALYERWLAEKGAN